MASSVEGREPFLDHELVELAMALPPHMKYRDGQGKHVLREAMRDALPPEILARPKQGFGSPMEEWLRGAVRPRRAGGRPRFARWPSASLLDYDVVDRAVRRPSPRSRRLEQAPVEPLLRQPVVRPVADLTAIACSTAASKASAIARWLKRSTSWRA